MVQQGVIKPVGDIATTWCHPMVCAEEPHGGFRICVDLTKLNKYVKRPIHPCTKYISDLFYNLILEVINLLITWIIW